IRPRPEEERPAEAWSDAGCVGEPRDALDGLPQEAGGLVRGRARVLVMGEELEGGLPAALRVARLLARVDDCDERHVERVAVDVTHTDALRSGVATSAQPRRNDGDRAQS